MPQQAETEPAQASGELEPWHVLRFRGELDCARAGRLRQAIDERLAACERPRLAIDLGDVSFCDSYGLSVLVYAAKKVRERGGTLLLSSVSRQVRMLIERCGLQRLLTLP
ncbi:STAS domain-containing protein [Spirillospora sp. CA-255316]